MRSARALRLRTLLSPIIRLRLTVLSLMSLVLCSPLARPGVAIQTPAEASSVDEGSRAVQAFEREWAEALEAFELEFAGLDPGARPPEHPSLRFADRALELLESEPWPDGEVWVLAQLDRLLWRPQRKRELRAELTLRLLERELTAIPPNQVEPLSPAVARRLELGLLELARATFEVPWSEGNGRANEALKKCEEPGVKGAALWALGQYATEANTSSEEDSWVEGDRFLTQVVEDYGATRAAELAAPVLCDLMSRRYEAEYDRWWTDLEDTEAAPDPELHPALEWWPRFEGLADRGVGVALWWLIRNADAHTETDEQRRELRVTLFQRVVESHANALWLVEAIPEVDTMVDEESVATVLQLGRRLLDLSTHPEVRAAAMFEMAGLASRDETDDERVGLALQLLGQLVAEQPRHQLSRAAAARIYELENLRIGSLAPEVVISEQEGGPLRLSDYRGRVTLVVFWGYGFGGERGLRKTLAPFTDSIPSSRFVVLGVNTDDRGPRLEERLRRDAFRWDHILVGGPSAAWPATWGVRRYPTSFLLDEQGRIVAKHLTGQLLADAIRTTLTSPEDGGVDD